MSKDECLGLTNFNNVEDNDTGGPTENRYERRSENIGSLSSWVTSFDDDESEFEPSRVATGDEVIDDDVLVDNSPEWNHSNVRLRENISMPQPNCLGTAEELCSGVDRVQMLNNAVESNKKNATIKNFTYAKQNVSNDKNGQIELDSDDQVDKVKSKLLSMWNNMKNGWTIKTKTTFRYDSPIWLLGYCYHKQMEEEEIKSFIGNENRQRSHSIIHGFSHFKSDFFSRLWFTYRREFPTLAGSTFTSDCGWGCMLRSGQMMLAQGFMMHFLGRCWNWYVNQKSNVNKIHRDIVRWFGDVPSRQSPFSIHQLVSLGSNSGKKVGDWYGPASVAHLFKQAMEIAQSDIPSIREVGIYIAQDCTIYKQDVYELCQKYTGKWRGIMLLVPVRLGGEKLNPIYMPCVRSILANEACIGIIGGRPRHSLYFVGWQEDSLIYLDPHYCQPVVDVLCDDFPLQSFHCMSPRKMAIEKMDPSCTIGFYCKTESDLNFFLNTIKDVLVPPKQKADYPIFIVAEGKSTDASNSFMHNSTDVDTPDKILKVTHHILNSDGQVEGVVESEEFVIL